MHKEVKRLVKQEVSSRTFPKWSQWWQGLRQEEAGAWASMVAVGMEGKGWVGKAASRSNGLNREWVDWGVAREREVSRKSPR